MLKARNKINENLVGVYFCLRRDHFVQTGHVIRRRNVCQIIHSNLILSQMAEDSENYEIMPGEKTNE